MEYEKRGISNGKFDAPNEQKNTPSALTKPSFQAVPSDSPWLIFRVFVSVGYLSVFSLHVSGVRFVFPFARRVNLCKFYGDKSLASEVFDIEGQTRPIPRRSVPGIG